MSPKYETLVIKIGTSTLVNEKGKLDLANLKRLVLEIVPFIKENKKVILVTSGAIVCGAEKLGLSGKPKTIPEKQAAAAIGQSILMRQYEKAFEEYGIIVGQVLLTRDAIADRERYLHARNTITTLLKNNVVPIVNENDTVAIEEIKVGDNDNLSALVASLVGADLLIILTDIDGFYLPSEEGIPYLVPEVKEITKEIESAAQHPSTQLGTGGMLTKIQAAKICSDAGISLVIASGRKSGLIKKIIAGEKIGTYFHPKMNKLESRKRWLAHGLALVGSIVLDKGAEEALRKGKSLLSAGVVTLKGSFKAGDLVSLFSEVSGKEIGRGLVNYNFNELERIKKKKSSEISKLLYYPGPAEVIHRDNLVLL